LGRYVEATASIVQEATKTIVIAVYLVAAFWLLLGRGEPEAFIALLPWALRVRAHNR